MIVSRAAARELEVHVVRGGGCSIARQLAITDSQSPETPQGDRTTPCPRGHVANACSSVRWCRYFGRPQKRAERGLGS